VSHVGLRELRQDASGIVRRVEQGESVDITVAGRLAARLVPIAPQHWLGWGEVASIFDGPADADWPWDREQVDQSLDDPWEVR
jgi:prevent-host-death family protein